MFHFQHHSHRSRAARGSGILSLGSSIPTKGEGHSPSSYGTSMPEPALGGQTPVLHCQLGKAHAGPVGPGRGAGLSHTFHTAALSAPPSEGAVPLLRGGEPATDQDQQHAGDRSYHAQWAGLPVHSLSCVQERRRPEAGNKPETIEQVRAYRALQDGRHPCLEGPAKSRRLDGKSGPQGCILHAPHPRRGQSVPQVLVPEPNLPVQVPALWPRMRPLGLHQDPEARHRPAQTAGRATDRLCT